MRRSQALFSLAAVGVLCVGLFAAIAAFVSPARADIAAPPTAVDFYTNGGSMPWGTAFDASGRVWVAMPGCDPSPYCSSNTPPGRLDVYNPQSSSWAATYTLPAGFGQPLFIAFDKQNRAWFPMPMTNTLGMFDLSTKTFNQWAVPTSASGPWGVAVDSKGIVWFTEHYANKIGSFNPATQSFTEIATPASNSVPYGITVDSQDNIWFTENSDAVALIGEYTAGGTLKEYKIRNGSTSGVTPHLIAVDGNGNVWWSEGWAGALGKLSVSSAVPGTNNGVSEYNYQHLCSNCGVHTSGMTADGNGYVWFTDSLQGIYGYFNVSGAGVPSVFGTPTNNPHPHDGIHAAPNNVIWFTEEFANKLGKITGGPGGSGGNPTPTPTTPGTTPTPTATTPPPTPTPTNPPSGTTLATDTFQRANQSLWGTASDGHAWGGEANSSSSFTISGNKGLVTNTNGMSYSAVLGSSAANAEVLVTGSISNFSNNNFGAVLRWTDGNNWYKGYLSGGNLIIQKKVNGSTSTLASVAFTAQANTPYSLRFRVVGSTLSLKAWDASTTEPATWTTSATDSGLTNGQAGLRILSTNATTTVTAFSAQAF